MTFSSILCLSNKNDDDYIGNESCIDFQTENISLASSSEKKLKSCIRNREMKREFPPPIPCLAQTQNLASHMPYVLKRYYTDEGRLIIMEEKVKHHEYFHAHRENGRLTLELVALGDDDDDYFMEADEKEEEDDQVLAPLPTSLCEEINNVTNDPSVVMNDDFDEEKEENMDNTKKNADDVVVDDENANEIVGAANSRGNCLNCNSVISSSSGIFGVRPLRPIRTG